MKGIKSMHIVIAPDSYKGSLSANEVAKTMEKAILSVDPYIKTTLKPMADGGEGTLDALETSIKGQQINISCTGPLGDKIETSYLIANSNIAIIEYAMIAGLTLVPEEKRHPDYTTSYGIGEVLIDALNRGCTSFLIGIGGSATNDGGLGMLLALGMRATDKDGHNVNMFGKNVADIHDVCFKNLDKRLKDVSIKIASDVTNPLCGKNGATYVFGQQKGLTKNQLKQYDIALYSFAQKVENKLGEIFHNYDGAGAAGGLGFAFLSIGATLVSGAKLIATHINLEHSIKEATLVLTGEGKSDYQTLLGKAPVFVSTLAKRHNVPTLLISGSLKIDDVDQLRKYFSGCFSIQTSPISLQNSLSQSKKLLYEKTKSLIQFIINLK